MSLVLTDMLQLQDVQNFEALKCTILLQQKAVISNMANFNF